MKNILTYATLAVLAVAIVFTSCNRDEDVRVTGVTLSSTQSTLPVPYTYTLVAAITPENATNQTVTWTSSNDAFATVENGIVTAVAPGNVTITVTTEDGNFSASHTFEITPQYFPVTGLTLNYNTWTTHALNATFTFEATITPENASFPEIVWTSSDEEVATVVDGLVTSIGEGTATIRAASVRSPEVYAEAAVTVELIPVQSFSLTRDDNIVLHYLANGQARGIVRLDVANMTPANASNTFVDWVSSDTNIIAVATVTTSTVTARIQARGVGTATITVTARDGSGFSAQRTITVSADAILPDHCVDHAFDLGTVSFLSNEEWEVGNQIWSDVVIATGCVPADTEWISAEHGGGWQANAGFRTHCRQVADTLGHGFSWCAVMRFRDQLCPDGWRVPTMQDFIDLDLELNGIGSAQGGVTANEAARRLTEYYIPEWVGSTSNFMGTFSIMSPQDGFQGIGQRSFYWSMSEATSDSQAIGLTLQMPNNPAEGTAGALINPQHLNSKGMPGTLRCVRNR